MVMCVHSGGEHFDRKGREVHCAGLGGEAAVELCFAGPYEGVAEERRADQEVQQDDRDLRNGRRVRHR